MDFHETDKHVGAKIRELRALKGVSQQDLGKLLNCTFQQIQKYEKGLNRVSSSKLYHVAKTYNKSLDWFFDSPIVDTSRDDLIFNRNISVIKNRRVLLALRNLSNVLAGEV